MVSSAGVPRKNAGDGGHDSDSDLETKLPSPPVKRPRKAVSLAKTKPTKAVATTKRASAPPRSDGGFDLHDFMASFSSSTAREKSAASEERPAGGASASTEGVALESAKFRTTASVLMAISSGRLGSRGLTVMHFKESSEMTTLEDGSTNANFFGDFIPSASLPPAAIKCASYEDILDDLHGLNSLGQEAHAEA
ncbi:hypothetical protein PF001_g17787 [Phytophthora fragariae]|uniref:Uncharacterized protein n=1 Tax=Phytophthora fragariae TaxID=53985 RepID=A0A6A4CY99_9STRA|nr:hypothetical protein PF009_g19700 [Phytophthora fragariae]KAE8992206.1 hypothetical protein PF011_g17638 [Phytophthora fragariae]KAE9294424.1 hypothetical protein PF001_g17787 [Phytophthora fragariae]